MSKHFVKRTKCPVCYGDSLTVIHSVRFSDERIWPLLDSHYEGRIPKEVVELDYFNIARCNNCTLLFQAYILNNSNMFSLYNKWIITEVGRDKKRFSDFSFYKNYVYELEGICRFFKKIPHEINILDYGMGWGLWSNLAKAFSFNVTGVEISKVMIDFAGKSGLRIIEDISQEKSNSYVH